MRLGKLIVLLTIILFSFSFVACGTSALGSDLTGAAKNRIRVKTQILKVNSSNLPSGTSGTTYSTKLSAAGGSKPYSWSASTVLPTGLTLSTDGTVSGVPKTTGKFVIGVVVTDSSAVKQNASGQVSLTVTSTTQPATTALSITTSSLSGGQVSKPYSGSLSANGGNSPYSWTANSGLPAGLSLSLGGVLSGTPTTAGNYNLSVTVVDTSSPIQTATTTLSFSIAQASTTTSSLAISTAALPAATSGSSYSTTLSATGGASPYSWSTTGGLPAGMALSSNGVLSGTPTTAGTFQIPVAVRDSSSTTQSASSTLQLTVSSAPAPITSTPTGSYLYPSIRLFTTCWDYSGTSACASSPMWQGQHLDMELSGNPGAAKAYNPNLVGIQYTLSYYGESQNSKPTDTSANSWWSALHNYAVANGVSEEDMYLHSANPFPGCPTPSKTKACRLSFTTWGTSAEEDAFGNMGNSNYVKFLVSWLNQINTRWPGFNGWFFDTNDAQAVFGWTCSNKTQHNYLYSYDVPAMSLEYGTNCTQVYSDFKNMMAAVKSGFSGPVVPNLQMVSGNPDPNVDATTKQMATNLGWAFPEGLNTVFHKYTDFWPVVDNYLTSGVKVVFSLHAYTTQSQFWGDFPEAQSGSFNAGNYDTDLHRYGMTTLVTHYMLQPNGTLGNNYFYAPQAEPWSIDFNQMYPQNVIAIDIGTPVSSRYQINPSTGAATTSTQTDGAGQISSTWIREFTKAWIVERPKSAYTAGQYGDNTKMTVTLPAGTFQKVNWDGTTTPVSGTIQLRNVEGVILLK